MVAPRSPKTESAQDTGIQPSPPPKQAVHISKSFKTETFTSHKQKHVYNQGQVRTSRQKNIEISCFQKREYCPFYLQQLPKVLEICEALSPFLKTPSLQPFPMPCLQGHRAKGLGFKVSKWEKQLYLKDEHCTHIILLLSISSSCYLDLPLCPPIDEVYFLLALKTLYVITGNHFNIIICKKTIWLMAKIVKKGSFRTQICGLQNLTQHTHPTTFWNKHNWDATECLDDWLYKTLFQKPATRFCASLCNSLNIVFTPSCFNFRMCTPAVTVFHYFTWAVLGFVHKYF